MKKIAVSVTISEDLLKWIEKEIETSSRFASVSHAVEYSLRFTKQYLDKTPYKGMVLEDLHESDIAILEARKRIEDEKRTLEKNR